MTKISLQTFTIRRDLKSAARMKEALERVSAVGIRTLEAARLRWSEGEASGLKEICDRLGMQVGSTQITFDALDKRFDAMVRIHRLLGCKYAVVSVMPLSCLIRMEKGFEQFAGKLNELGARYREQGITLLHHHHHFEFLKFGDRLGIDLLMDQTDPRNVGLAIDTYWTQRGGLNPSDFIRRYEGRVKVVHLRDFRLQRSGWRFLPSDCEIGAGALSFGPIVEACLASGVDYMAIEQNSAQPYRSIEQSASELRRLGYAGLF